jgi:hypothetical protein
MNAESVRKLVSTYLLDEHKVHGAEFVDALLLVAFEAGDIKCSLTSEDHLKFDVHGEPTFTVAVARAKSKLRALCARLSALCNESGDQDVSPYGGAGFIRKRVPLESAKVLISHAHPAGSGEPGANGPSLREDGGYEQRAWAVRFMNTPDEHYFTLCPQRGSQSRGS